MMLLALCAPADAQQRGKTVRIGLLDPSTASGSALLIEAFRQELGRLGWFVGKNLAIEYRFGEGKGIKNLPALAAELVRLPVDVIVVNDTPAALAAKKLTSAIPIVMTNAGDPVGVGLVASLARPGGNVTGLSSLGRDLNSKRLEILKDSVANLTRVAVLRPATGSDRQLKDLRPAAAALNLQLEEVLAHVDAKGLESAFQIARQKQVGAIVTTTATTFYAERKRIVELAGKYRLPAIYPQDDFVETGGLMFYGVDFDDLYRRAAVYVDKILRGAKPSELPVEQATKFEFIINLKAAKQIGLTIPPRVIERANRVIR
jgi:putative ABC transport system substrate-binding protein